MFSGMVLKRYKRLQDVHDTNCTTRRCSAYEYNDTEFIDLLEAMC